MGDATILTTHYDTLKYDEGEGRVVEFNCPSTVEPPQVRVPGEGYWREQVPAWARELRGEIVGRLRSAGAVLWEREADCVRVVSGDGRLQIEFSLTPDERAAPWEETCLVLLPSGERAASLPLYAAEEPIRFLAEGVVSLPLRQRYGATFVVLVNGARGTFRFAGEGEERPLSGLADALVARTPGPKAPLVVRRAVGGKLSGWLLVLGGWYFV